MPRWSRLAAVGAAAAAYPFFEPYRYRLERKVVPVSRPLGELTVLHVSDTHLHARDERLIGFLPQTLPEQSRTSIVHGDYRIDNAVFDGDGTLTAVLDWELATLGERQRVHGAIVGTSAIVSPRRGSSADGRRPARLRRWPRTSASGCCS